MILPSRFLRSGLSCLVLVLGACGGLDVKEHRQANFAPWISDSGVYQLRPGDEVEVKLPFTPELGDKEMVDPAGNISMPLIGTVRVAGLTLDQVTSDLKRRYAQHLRDPEVYVAQRGFGSQKIFVGGEVGHPGIVELPGRIGALEAITMAGGLLDTAESKKIAIIRRAPDGRPMLRVIDFGGYVAPAEGETDVPLKSMDVVFVPKSSIAEVDLFISQYVTKALPFDRSVGYSTSSTLK